MAFAFGDEVCDSTKSARSFRRGEAAPASIFSTTGIAFSGSWRTRLPTAMSLISSSVDWSGLTGCPEACFTSTWSARASFTQRPVG